MERFSNLPKAPQLVSEVPDPGTRSLQAPVCCSRHYRDAGDVEPPNLNAKHCPRP